MRYTRILVAVLACAAACRGDEAPAAAPSPSESIASRLPPDIGAAARTWLHGDSKEMKAMLAFSPGALEQEVMVALASEPGRPVSSSGGWPARLRRRTS